MSKKKSKPKSRSKAQSTRPTTSKSPLSEGLRKAFEDDEIEGPIVDAIFLHEDNGLNTPADPEPEDIDDPDTKVFVNVDLDFELEEFLDTVADSYPLGSDAYRVCTVIRFLVRAPWQEDDIDMIRDLAHAKAVLDDLMLGYLDKDTGQVIGVPTQRTNGRRS